MKRCGFVAVIGAPNAGKSTLINEWVGSKVSIVSAKVQTTRSLVRGIAMCSDSQIVFIDTPGIFKPGPRLERAMVAAAWQGREDADITVLVVDASRRKIDADTHAIIDRIKQQEGKKPCLLVMNKIDRVARDTLLAFSMQMNQLYAFDATFMVSALKADRTGDVLDHIAAIVPPGEWHFPDDQVSDMPMRLLAAEITREKLFRKLHHELPYGLAVETEQWEPFDDGSVKISQIIYVEKDSHKGIVLGKGGAQIKEIGALAREELEEILEGRVHLKLFVKLQENWREDPEKFRLWGLDYSA